MAFVPWKDRVTSTPHRYKLTQVSADTYDLEAVPGAIGEAGTPVNAENLNKLLQRDGDDIKDTVTTFAEADTRENIATGEKTSTIFGKIKKWYTDLKAHAFNDLATALGTETDKAPTNKLLNDTAALKANTADLKPHAFNDLATVQGTETDKAPTNKLLKESSFARVYREATEISGITYPVSITDLLNKIIADNLLNCMFVIGMNSSTETKVTGLPTIGEAPQTYGTLTIITPSTSALRMRVEYSKEIGNGTALTWLGSLIRSGNTVTSVNWKQIIDDSSAQTISGVKTYTASPIVPTTPSGASAAVAKSYVDGLSTPYSKVIRTQAEFNELIASPTWLGATSVALVGQFTLSTANNSGIKIPATVKQIHGFNGAKITITNFKYNLDTAKGGLWYDTLPTTLDYSIRDLEVDCTGTDGSGRGFYNCTNLTNCTGTGTGTSYGYGFRNCTNLTNCTGTGTGTSYGYGFYKCTNLTNCTGTGTGTYGYGFYNCTNLTNCTGTGTGTGAGYGFGFCTNLTNCTGTGTGTPGYGFYGISYASNCSDGGSSTDMWGGINKNINVDGLSTPYSKVIRTQAEFEELIASPNWLGATSVALVGQFTLSTANNSGIKIPATVKQIHGFNSAKITVTNFVYNATTAKGGLWYDTRPTTLDYSIRDLEVDCTGTSYGYGFYNCTNLTNCTGTGTGTGATNGYGFQSCTNLTNCTGTGTGTSGVGFRDCTNLTNCTGTGTGTSYGYGFYNCTNLTNCTGTGTGTGATNGYGFFNCTNLTNCTGTGTGTGTGTSYGYGFYNCKYASNCTGTGTGATNGYGFRDCTNLTNCTGTGTGTGATNGYGFFNCTNLTNCTGTGTSYGYGYGFYNCNYASNCKDGGSKTDMWGGMNKNIDVETCRKTLSTADNTTLNT